MARKQGSVSDSSPPSPPATTVTLRRSMMALGTPANDNRHPGLSRRVAWLLLAVALAAVLAAGTTQLF